MLKDMQFWELLFGFLTVLITTVIGFLTAWAKQKTQSTTMKNAIDILDQTLQNVVNSVQQTYVEAIRAAHEDGILTEAEKIEAKRQAVDMAKAALSPGLMAMLSLAYDNLDELISHWIEAKITEAKIVVAANAPR